MNLSTHKRSEVELRVAQELKNNQDFIYQTNQAIQNLKRSVDCLSAENIRILNQFENDKAHLKAAFADLNDDVLESLRETKNIIKDIADDQNRLRDIFSTQIAELKQGCAQIDIVSSCFQILKDCHEGLLADFAKLKDFVISNNELLKGKIEEKARVLKEELSEKQVYVNPFHDEILNKMKAMCVDFKGLQKEIEILKRSSFYEEKKFEYLNTQLQRLKAGTDEPSR